MKRTAFIGPQHKKMSALLFLQKKEKRIRASRDGIGTYACHWARVSPSTLYVNSIYELSKKKRKKKRAYVRKVARRMRGHVSTYVLYHIYVVHADDIDLIDAFRLELVVLFNVFWRLRMTRGRKGSRHANLLD